MNNSYQLIIIQILFEVMGWLFSDDDQNRNGNKSGQDKPHSNTEIVENVQSYSSSRSCYTDPEDQTFMICKQKRVSNGKEQINETRMPASQYQFGMPSIFSTLFRGFDESKSIFDQRLNQLQGDLSQDFDKIAFSFMPFLSILDPEMHQRQSKESRKFSNLSGLNKNGHSPRRHSRNEQQDSNKFGNQYFRSSDRDFEIRDL